MSDELVTYLMDFDQTVHGPYGEHVPVDPIREKVTA